MSGNDTEISSSPTVGITSYSYKVISSLFMSTLIVVIIAGNLLAIAAYCKATRFRVVTRCFIVNLAVTDLVVGAIIMPFWFYQMLRENQSLATTIYKSWITLDIACATASMSSLAVVSMDRYITISEPLSYEKRLSKALAVFVIFLVWFYAFGVALLREINWYYYSVLVTVFSFVVPLSIMLFAYVNIFKMAKIQARRIRLSSLPNLAQSRLNQKRFDKELKATKTISLVIGAFLLCWLPFFVVTLLAQYCARIQCDITFELIIMVKWLHYANSAMNPIIYALHNRDFRAAMQAILPGKPKDYVLESTADHSLHHLVARTTNRDDSRQ